MALSVVSKSTTYSQFPVIYTGKITTDHTCVGEIISSDKHSDCILFLIITAIYFTFSFSQMSLAFRVTHAKHIEMYLHLADVFIQSKGKSTSGIHSEQWISARPGI